MIVKLAAVVAAFASAVSAVAPFLVSNVPLCHEEAVSYCAAQGSRLADINMNNRDQAIAQLHGDAAWISSWNYDGYNGECMSFLNGHVGAEECKFKQLALCNPIVVYDSSSSSSSSSSRSARMLSDLQKSGPSQKSRHSRPCPVESSSSSSSCFSSSSHCDSSSACCDPEYRYIYLTNTVTTISNVQVVVTSTSTTTFFFTIGTVAAYTVTGPDA